MTYAEMDREPAMTIEISTPELEQLVQEEIRRGDFQSVDDLLTEALQALGEKKALSSHGSLLPPNSPAGSSVMPEPDDERPIWEVVTDMMKDVPPEDMAALPSDGASQVDHYIYGLPKRH